MTIAIAILLVVLLGLLTLSSYVEKVFRERGKFLSRGFQDNIESFELKVEPRLKESKDRAEASVAVLSQLCTAGIAFCLMYLVMANGTWTPQELAQAALAMIIAIIVFNRLLPFVFFTRTRGDWLVPFAPVLRVLIWLLLPVTIVLGFCQQIAALAEQREPVETESHSEAVEALIEAGQEEGILEEGDRELIQSVVEFRDKTVREVMTPRPEITAVPSETTIEAFVELIKNKPYSRVPVYEGSIDNIRGLVFAHDVLQVSDTEAKSRTVAYVMKPVHFVPESKPVQALMREMQKDNLHLAIVIDEYGSVAGVVTMEDLLEELVGEIRDEHEPAGDVVKENENSYIVPGNMDVDRLNELFGARIEDVEATTIAGLVSEVAGHIPKPGEVIQNDGLRFEVLQATDRVVERVRVCVARPEQQAKPLRA